MKGKKIFLFIVLIVAFIAFFSPKIYDNVQKIIYPVMYEDIILECSKENNLDPYMVLGLIKAESNFVSDAVSSQGATGLMQLTYETAEWMAKKAGPKDFDVEMLKEPEVNIHLGCSYMRYLLDEFKGDITLALSAYNAGIGNVNKWLSDKRYSSDGVTLDKIPFTETKNYVINTQKYEEKYKEIYPDIWKNIIMEK